MIFDLRTTLNSGQVFHWTEVAPDAWAGCIDQQPIVIKDAGNTVSVDHSLLSLVESYLRLDSSHEKALATFPQDDTFLAESVALNPGLRIIRQPLWECLATFITSSLKQVAHIRQISLHLRERFGEEKKVLCGTESHRVYSYPTPEVLAEVGEQELRKCGLGYRAKSLHLTASSIADGSRPLVIDHLSDQEALAYLMGYHGVGGKIANCALLFGAGRMSAFPIDVWMDRILRENYFGPRKRKTIKPKELQAWANKHFGPCAGYAQQFLFHRARVTDNLPS